MKKKLDKESVSKVKNTSGIYKIYSCNNELLYVGRSKVLRHRLQSYYQKDDFSVNRTKKPLRKVKCKKFLVRYTSDKKARDIEKKIKNNGKFNYR